MVDSGVYMTAMNRTLETLSTPPCVRVLVGVSLTRCSHSFKAFMKIHYSRLLFFWFHVI